MIGKFDATNKANGKQTLSMFHVLQGNDRGSLEFATASELGSVLGCQDQQSHNYVQT